MELITKAENENKTVTSLEVAEMIGDDHKELLKKIRLYSGYLDEGNIPLIDFFIESSYKDSRSREKLCFEVTRKGCDMIANKMTGAKGVIFTAKYIERFHQMEEVIKKPTNQIELIHMITTEMVSQNKKLETLENDVAEIKDNSPMFPLECSSISNTVRKRGVELMGGKNSNTYQDRSLRSKVYRSLYSGLKNEFGVSNYQAIKRKDFEKALNIAKNLNLPLYLKEEVADKNNQLNLFEGDK